MAECPVNFELLAKKRQKKQRRQLRNRIILGSTVALVVGGLGYYFYKSRKQNTKEQNSKKDCGSQCVCCGTDVQESSKDKNIKQIVKDRYSATARNFTSKQQKSANNIAQVFGYSEKDLNEFGSDSNMGLSCGNPVAQASIREGEVVMDLGSGGGFDSFLALKKVGKTGKVIGIDMSKDMIDRATRNAKKRGYALGDINDIQDDDVNISFYNTEIENMEYVSDNYVDCIISNCVLNLVPDKLRAFKEIYRVLKGNGKGRLAISDIAFKKPFPKEFNGNMAMYVAGYVNCISGAILKDEYKNLLIKAGFKTVKFVEKNTDLNVWKSGWESGGVSGGCCGTKEDEKETENNNTNSDEAGCCGPSNTSCCGPPTESKNKNNNNDNAKAAITFTEEEINNMRKALKNINLNDYVASYYIFAVKD